MTPQSLCTLVVAILAALVLRETLYRPWGRRTPPQQPARRSGAALQAYIAELEHEIELVALGDDPEHCARCGAVETGNLPVSAPIRPGGVDLDPYETATQ